MNLKISLFVFLLFCGRLNAQTTSSTPDNYDVVVFFGSICCGPPSDDFLKDFVSEFAAKNKVVINAWQLGGCGREGESKVMISLFQLKKSKKKKFLTAIQQLVPRQNEKNKTANGSSGNISLEYNLPSGNQNDCRGKLTKWKFTTQQ